MINRTPQGSAPKAAVSVSEMARVIGLSYNHFRALCKRGVFPMPAYGLGNHRPFFDLESQQACLQIRQTNIGFNGQFVLFYGPRKQVDSSHNGKKPEVSERAVELAKALKHLGMEVNGQQVEAAIPVVFSKGLPPDDGQAIRSLFLHLKKAIGQ